IDWQQLHLMLRGGYLSGLLAKLVQEESIPHLTNGHQPGSRRLTREFLLSVSLEKRRELLEEYIAWQSAKVLRLPVEKLDIQQPLNNFGLDSLVAVELKNQVEADLGISIPIANLLQGVSIAQLITLVQEQLGNAAAVAVLPQALGETAEKFPLS